MNFSLWNSGVIAKGHDFKMRSASLIAATILLMWQSPQPHQKLRQTISTMFFQIVSSKFEISEPQIPIRPESNEKSYL
jgi:hypothetical protein